VSTVEANTWSVGEVARLAGVTVRTLHHYDRIGLLRPTVRSAAGYRGYDQADLARLQRILGYRELGFALDDIVSYLADPRFTAHYEQRAPGLAQYVHDAILANAARSPAE
jgi:MerR family transcriptional regulator, thiopeptide resistance regulator